MSGYQVMGVLDDVSKAMTDLRDALRGAPARTRGLVKAHERLSGSVARVATAVEYSTRTDGD